MTAPALVTRGNGPAALFEDDRDADAWVEWMRSKTTDVFTVTTTTHAISDLDRLDAENTKLTDDLAEAEKDRDDWRSTAKEHEERANVAEESAKNLRASVGALRDKIENVRVVIGED